MFVCVWIYECKCWWGNCSYLNEAGLHVILGLCFWKTVLRFYMDVNKLLLSLSWLVFLPWEHVLVLVSALFASFPPKSLQRLLKESFKLCVCWLESAGRTVRRTAQASSWPLFSIAELWLMRLALASSNSQAIWEVSFLNKSWSLWLLIHHFPLYFEKKMLSPNCIFKGLLFPIWNEFYELAGQSEVLMGVGSSGLTLFIYWVSSRCLTYRQVLLRFIQ